MNYPLDGFNHKYIQQTETLRQMIETSSPPVEQIVVAFIERTEIFHLGELKKCIEAEDFSVPKEAYLTRILGEHGYRSGRFKANSISLWYPKSVAKPDVFERYQQSIAAKH